MIFDKAVVQRLITMARESTASRPAATAALFAAITEHLIDDVGPANAIAMIEGLLDTLRAHFDTGTLTTEETIQ